MVLIIQIIILIFSIALFLNVYINSSQQKTTASFIELNEGQIPGNESNAQDGDIYDGESNNFINDSITKSNISSGKNSESLRDILPVNYQDIIVESNIFKLKKSDPPIEEQEKIYQTEEDNFLVEDVEDTPDDTREDLGESIREEEIIVEEPIQTEPEKHPLHNPFVIQAISINGGNRKAIILNQELGQTFIISSGVEVAGFLVKEIRLESIILEKEGQQTRVEF